MDHLPHIVSSAECSAAPSIVGTPSQHPCCSPRRLTADLRASYHHADRIPLLWIDDEVRDEDAAVWMLELEGYAIDVARNGAEGLALGLTRSYAAVLLDLRLPDMDGLDVLSRLRAVGPLMPVMILSGFVDVELAGAAVRLGVRDIRAKPLLGDDLVRAVQGLMQSSEADPTPAGSSRQIRYDGDHAILAHAAIELTRRDLSGAEFVSLSDRFRRLVEADSGDGGRSASRGDIRLQDRAARSRLIERILVCIDQDLASREKPALYAVAARVHASRDDVADVLSVLSPGGFRACCRALRIRPVLAAVAFSEEQYAQIAYQFGYEHPTQFTRDFHAVLGLTPHEFRAIVFPASAR